MNTLMIYESSLEKKRKIMEFFKKFLKIILKWVHIWLSTRKCFKRIHLSQVITIR